jgi:hypothetical protein
MAIQSPSEALKNGLPMAVYQLEGSHVLLFFLTSRKDEKILLSTQALFRPTEMGGLMKL